MRKIAAAALCLSGFASSALALKLPTTPPKPEFVNALGSDIPKDFAIMARKEPSTIVNMAETIEELDKLKREALARQYVLLIDKSGSMSWDDTGNKPNTRWQSAEQAVARIIDTIFKYDIDHKVPVYLFGSDVEDIGELTDSKQVLQLFKEHKPGGTTNLAAGLRAALHQYLGKARSNYKNVPGTTVIILTDGEPNSQIDVENLIKEVTDPAKGYIENHEELALSFIQIDDDKEAEAFLKKLDDNFQPDICDTKKDDIFKVTNGLDKVLYDAIFN